MGPILPKPVLTKVEERAGSSAYRSGSSCMNGFRERMEDAHCMVMRDEWGFFGVFDGHVGPKASQFMAARFPQCIEREKIPISDDRVSELALQLDREFLDTGSEDGTTGTWFLTHPLGGGRHHVQVGNVGDSRVLIGRQGKCVEMTEDHKPNLAGERDRILAQGGHVQNNRVDGSLAVSRAFGDGEYKSTGTAQTHKVIAVPEFRHTECTADDFVFLSCDGVFESNFSNEEVIEFVYKCLERTDDLARVCSMVCDEALRRGSKDNISAMLVQLKPGQDFAGREVEVVPGPYSAPGNSMFREAYAKMCEEAHLSVAQTVERRHDYISRELEALRAGREASPGAVTETETREAWEKELAEFSEKEPPPAPGTKGRTDWFEQWLRDKVEAASASVPEGGGASGDTLQRILQLQNSGLPLPVILGLLSQGGLGPGAQPPGGGV
eukprot:TRINITY_DN60165_c0_g1_i1.p2 TRINITY_DN60165_c0_g1~~TRINITY_DN60165_c0_g1_i1.p2  ORF type:complete len:476 (+),score=121.20 TRINITY_DN60165_c0_g1_i1:114-1430(+)